MNAPSRLERPPEQPPLAAAIAFAKALARHDAERMMSGLMAESPDRR